MKYNIFEWKHIEVKHHFFIKQITQIVDSALYINAKDLASVQKLRC